MRAGVHRLDGDGAVVVGDCHVRGRESAALDGDGVGDGIRAHAVPIRRAVHRKRGEGARSPRMVVAGDSVAVEGQSAGVVGHGAVIGILDAEDLQGLVGGAAQHLVGALDGMDAGGGHGELVPFADDGAGTESVLDGIGGIEGSPVREAKGLDLLAGLEAEADGVLAEEGRASGAIGQFHVALLVGGVSGDDVVTPAEAQVVGAQDGLGEADIHEFVGIQGIARICLQIGSGSPGNGRDRLGGDAIPGAGGTEGVADPDGVQGAGVLGLGLSLAGLADPVDAGLFVSGGEVKTLQVGVHMLVGVAGGAFLALGIHEFEADLHVAVSSDGGCAHAAIDATIVDLLLGIARVHVGDHHLAVAIGAGGHIRLIEGNPNSGVDVIGLAQIPAGGFGRQIVVGVLLNDLNARDTGLAPAAGSLSLLHELIEGAVFLDGIQGVFIGGGEGVPGDALVGGAILHIVRVIGVDPHDEVGHGGVADPQLGGMLHVMSPGIEEVHVDGVHAAIGIQVAVIHAEAHLAGVHAVLVIDIDGVMLVGVGGGPDIVRVAHQAGDDIVSGGGGTEDFRLREESPAAHCADEGIAALLVGEHGGQHSGVAGLERLLGGQADGGLAQLIAGIVVDAIALDEDGLQGLAIGSQQRSIGGAIGAQQVDDHVVGALAVEDAGIVVVGIRGAVKSQLRRGVVAIHGIDREVLVRDGGGQCVTFLGIILLGIRGNGFEVGRREVAVVSHHALGEAQGDGAIVGAQGGLGDEESADGGEGQLSGGGGGGGDIAVGVVEGVLVGTDLDGLHAAGNGFRALFAHLGSDGKTATDDTRRAGQGIAVSVGDLVNGDAGRSSAVGIEDDLQVVGGNGLSPVELSRSGEAQEFVFRSSGGAPGAVAIAVLPDEVGAAECAALVQVDVVEVIGSLKRGAGEAVRHGASHKEGILSCHVVQGIVHGAVDPGAIAVTRPGGEEVFKLGELRVVNRSAVIDNELLGEVDASLAVVCDALQGVGVDLVDEMEGVLSGKLGSGSQPEHVLGRGALFGGDVQFGDFGGSGVGAILLLCTIGGGVDIEAETVNAVPVAHGAAVLAIDLIAVLDNEGVLFQVESTVFRIHIDPAEIAHFQGFIHNEHANSHGDLSFVSEIGEVSGGDLSLGQSASPEIGVDIGGVFIVGGIAGALPEDHQAIFGGIRIAVEVSVAGQVGAIDLLHGAFAAHGFVEGQSDVLVAADLLNLGLDDGGGRVVDHIGLASQEGVAVGGQVVQANEAISLAHIDGEGIALQGADGGGGSGGAADLAVGALRALVATGDGHAEVLRLEVASGSDLEGEDVSGGQEVRAVAGDGGDHRGLRGGGGGLLVDGGADIDDGHIVDVRVVAGAIHVVIEEIALEGQQGIGECSQGIDVHQDDITIRGVGEGASIEAIGLVAGGEGDGGGIQLHAADGAVELQDQDAVLQAPAIQRQLAHFFGNGDEIQAPLVGRETIDLLVAQEDVSVLLQDDLVGIALRHLVDGPDALGVGAIAVVLGAVALAAFGHLLMAVHTVHAVIPRDHGLPDVTLALLLDARLHARHGNAIGVRHTAGNDNATQVLVGLQGHVPVDVDGVDADGIAPGSSEVLVQVVPAVGTAVAPAHVEVIEPTTVVGAISIRIDGVSAGTIREIDGCSNAERHGTAGVQGGADGIVRISRAVAGLVVELFEGAGANTAGGLAGSITIVTHAQRESHIAAQATDFLVVVLVGFLVVGLGILCAGIESHERPVVGAALTGAAHAGARQLIALLHHVLRATDGHRSGEGLHALLGPLEVADNLGGGGGGAANHGVVGVAGLFLGAVHSGSGSVVVVAGVCGAAVKIIRGALAPLGLGEVVDPDVVDGCGLHGAGLLGGGVLVPLGGIPLVILCGGVVGGAAGLLGGLVVFLVGDGQSVGDVGHDQPAEGVSGGVVEGALVAIEEDGRHAGIGGDHQESLGGEGDRVAIDGAIFLDGHDLAAYLAGDAIGSDRVALAGKPSLRKCEGLLLSDGGSLKIHAKNQRKYRNTKTNESFQHLRFS